MKISSILILFFIAINSLLAIEILPFSEYENHKAKFDAEMYSKYKVVQKNTYREESGDKWMISNEYYNDSGKLVKYEAIGDNDAIVSYSTYKYNDEDLISEIIDKDAFHTILQKQVFIYDAFSRLSKIVSTDFLDNIIQTITYEYIPEKSIAIETIKDSANKVINYSVYLYDKAFNKIIKSTLYDTENNVDGTKVIHYNEYGINSREIYQKDINEPYTIKYQNIYNEKHLLSEIQNISYPNNIIVTISNEYNDKNFLISTKMIDKFKNPITTILYEYIHK